MCAAAAADGRAWRARPAVHRDRHPAAQPGPARGPGDLPEALQEAGLPAWLADAAETDEFDAAIKKSHHEAFDEVGLDVGTPVIRIRGKALFGPVITPAPKGEAAGELWDGLVLVSKADGFFELKRSRDRRPSFD